MEPQPWEVLDLDLDLDLHEDSLLVPCKRKNPLLSLSSTQTNKTLKPCSLTPQSHSPFHPTRIIPGPAGAVQSAMHRKVLMGSGGEDPIPTQEYIRRAVEDSGHEDEDFSRPPWLFAVDFVRRAGLVGSDGVAIGIPLSLIKTGLKAAKVNQIVAIVKSSSPNGLGDMMVTLKDPTGTIDASIHRRVFMEGEFGKDISVGAVLILQKVAVFSPSRCVHYLNITLGNIVKALVTFFMEHDADPDRSGERPHKDCYYTHYVINKDCVTPLELNHTALVVKEAAPGIESNEKSSLPPKTNYLSQGTTEGILNCLRQNASARQIVPPDKQMEEVNASSPSSSCGAGGSRSQSSGVVVRDADAAESMKEVALGLETDFNEQEILLDKQFIPSNQPGNDNRFSNSTPNLVDSSNNEENGNVNGVRKQNQLLTSTGPLPEWTDEQLDELLAFDRDDI